MMDVPEAPLEAASSGGMVRLNKGRGLFRNEDDDDARQDHHPLRRLLAPREHGSAVPRPWRVAEAGDLGVAGTMGYFGSLGFPPIFGLIVIIAEIGAGIALITGVGVRVVSSLALPISIGATMQHIGNGWMFSSARGGWEFPAFWTVLLLVQAGLGAGAFALDVNKLLGRQVVPANA